MLIIFSNLSKKNSRLSDQSCILWERWEQRSAAAWPEMYSQTDRHGVVFFNIVPIWTLASTNGYKQQPSTYEAGNTTVNSYSHAVLDALR